MATTIMLRIYGITYGDKKTEFIEYKNRFTTNLHRFEYNPMIDIVDNMIGDMEAFEYLGIFSWAFSRKTGLNQVQLHRKFQTAHSSAAFSEIQVFNLSPSLGNNIGGCGSFMNWSAIGHGETLRDLIKKCCHHCGLYYEENPANVIYANQFIARVDVYKEYMDLIIKPSLELLENDLWPIANQPANYSAGIKLSELKKHTGLDFYNYVPFVLERMMMQYVHNLNLKTVSLI